MKTIYYNANNNIWFHQDKGHSYTLGNNEMLLSFSKRFPSLSFRVKEKQGKVGPLVGILISDASIHELLKRRKRHIEMIHSYLQTCGGICVVFTLNNVQANKLKGYAFSDQQQTWIEVTAPLPHVVYNRMKNRDEEKTTAFREFIQLLNQHDIPYFNPCFFTKWQLYKILETNEHLRTHLPLTVQVRSSDDIANMLQMHKRIYMKPNEGYKGKGIFTLQYHPDKEEIVLEQMHERKILSRIDELYDNYNITGYIAQQAIESDMLNGNRYDLRILVHYDNGKYKMSGIGVRLSQSQQITTHIPNGGKIIPYKWVKDRINEVLLQTIVNECGLTLSAHLGFIGEFSIDIGRDTNGQLYIYELNSKPMIFDEQAIQKRGTKHLIAVFDQLSGFASS
jgi:glutathione synthase/RimK-type ligase-like ATP-grasp enzyme